MHILADETLSGPHLLLPECHVDYHHTIFLTRYSGIAHDQSHRENNLDKKVGNNVTADGNDQILNRRLFPPCLLLSIVLSYVRIF